jgi:hypothetical protein
MNAENRKLSPQFSIYVAIPIVLAALFGLWWLYMGAVWLRGALPPFWEQNKYTIIIIGAILLLGSTSHKWVPMLWGAHRARRLHEQEMLDRMAHRKLIEAAAVKMGEGFNTKYSNTKTGDLIEMLNPYVTAKASRQITEVPEGQEVKQIEAPKPIPEKVAYESVASQVPHGHALLGVDGRGVRTCEFGKILTCLILGGSGTGKSNTVSIKVEEAVKDGWRLIVIDPHRRKPDSLYNRIKEYSDRFIRFDWLPDGVAMEDDEIKNVLNWFNEEYKRRLKTGDQSFGDVLLICDEVGYVADLEDEETVKLLKRIAKVCGNESRGFGMAGWFINQNATGIAWLRKVVMTVITHKINMMSERRIACNENDALARNMDKWPKHGRVYVYGLSFEETYELQMPYKQEATRVVDAVPVGQNFYETRTEKLPEQRATHYYSPTSQTVASKSSDFSFEREAQPTKRIQTGELLGAITPLEKQLPNTSEDSEMASDDGKFKFNPDEAERVKDLYRAYTNIDKVLKHMERGARWYKDASRIVREAGLLKDRKDS